MAAWRLFGGDPLGVCAVVAVAACTATPDARNLPRAAGPDAAPAASVASSSMAASTDAAPPTTGASGAGAPGAAVPSLGAPPVVDPNDAVDELLDMVAVLAAAEAHQEALRALDASALAQDLDVAMARADLLRDLGRRHEALAAMRRVRDRLGAAAVDPQALFEIAELERLEGERAAARRTIAAIRELHGDAAWTRANSARLARVDGQLAAAEPVRAMSARDLLGNLRGAPEPSDRLAALRSLLDGAYADAAEAAAVRERAVAIAVGDAAEPVRLAGVAAWTFDAAVGRDFVSLALVDASPRVRRAAVVHAGKLPAAAAAALLFARLCQEDDVDVFLALHDGLRAAAGAGEPITPLDVATSAGRAAVVDRWRQGGLAKEAR